jgi:polyhydroxybutyrate depolymerase
MTMKAGRLFAYLIRPNDCVRTGFASRSTESLQRSFMNSLCRILACVFLLGSLQFSLTACANKQRSNSPERTGLRLGTIEFDGRERSYYLHLPANDHSVGRLPVVFVLHGGGRADGDEVASRTGFNSIADREGFIAVYPNGVDARWNDGRGKTFRSAGDNTDIDDVGYIAELVERIIRDYKGDPSRVYATGLSNGGMMTLRLGCEISDKLAAIAPVIANIPMNILGNCKPDSPLPVLLMNGTDDPLVPWQGGAVHFFRKTMGAVTSTAETVAFWTAHNQCNPAPTIELLADRDSKDHSRVEVSAYSQCANHSEVILYSIIGGGHSFPGGNIPDRPFILGNKNNDINAAEVIWGFFKEHERVIHGPSRS